MAVQDVRIRYSADTADLERSEQLLSKIGNDINASEKEVKRVNQQFDKQVGIIEGLENEFKQLQEARKKAQDPKEIAKYNKQLQATEGQLKKLKGDTGFGGLTKGVKQFGAAIAASISIGALATFATHLANTAVELENLSSKATTVFGSSLGIVENWARESAAAMGLSQAAAIGAATAMGDLLIPMGFTRDEAAKMSTEVVGLAGALSEWSGGQRSAEEVAQILAKAMLGEREQLKELGIAISEADVQQKLLEKGQSKLTGTMLQQAKAVATQELIFAKSLDAQAAYAKNGETLARTQAKLRALFTTISDTLARALLPAFKAIVGFVAKLAEGFANLIVPTDKLSDRLENQRVSVQSLGRQITEANITDEERKKRIDELVRIYPRMTELVDINTASNKELADALKIVNQRLLDQIKLALIQEEIDEKQAELKEAARRARENEKKVEEQFDEAIKKTGLTFDENTTKVERVRRALDGLKVAYSEVTNEFGQTEFVMRTRGTGLYGQERIASDLIDAYRSLGRAELSQAAILEDINELQEEYNIEAERTGASLDDLTKKTEDAGKAAPNGVVDPKKSKASKKGVDLVRDSVAELSAIITKLQKAQKNVATDSVAFNILKKRIEEAKFALQSALTDLPDVDAMNPFGEFDPAGQLKTALDGNVDRARKAYEEWLERVSEDQPTMLQKIEEGADKATEAFGQIFNTYEQIQELAFARDLARLDKMREAQLDAAGDDAEKREQIEADFDARADALRRKQFEEEKRAAILRATIEGTLMVIKSIVAGGGIPSGLPQGALAAIAVAGQIAAIQAQTFAKGGFTGKGSVRDHTGERVAGVVHEDEFVFQKKIAKRHLPEFTRIWKGEDPYKVFASNTNNLNATFGRNDQGIIGAFGKMGRSMRREMQTTNRYLRKISRGHGSRLFISERIINRNG